MVLFNYSTKELTAKIVYYGPGLCGKTTNLQFIFESLPGDKRGRMLSLSTQTDRTLYFDFLPMDLGEIRGMKTRIQLYTVPGQVFYNETRKMVLKGVDGVVFVADSQAQMADANLESFGNLMENLEEHGLESATMPLVLQFNKRDLPSIQSVEEMNAALNRFNAPFYEAIATTGIGVHDTLKAISKLVLRSLSGQKTETAAEERTAAAPPVQPVAPAAEPVAASPVAASPQAIPDETVTDQEALSVESWDDENLESELDGMDAAEIEGLLQEVEGLDLGDEALDLEPRSTASVAAAEPAANGGSVAASPAPPAEDDLLAVEELDLDALPDGEPVSAAGGPEENDELFATELEPDTPAPPAAPGEPAVAGGDVSEAPSFESFMADQGSVPPSAAVATATAVEPPVVQLVDGGQVSIPVVLERDGRPVRFTLTLRLQPEDQAPV